MERKILKLLTLFVLMALLWAVPSEAVYNTWNYKVKINANNPGASRTDYPVRIEVPADIYIEAGRMNSDMRDVRFSQGSNELPFWIHISEGMQREIKNIPVYVKIQNYNSGDNTIFMHFDSTKDENDSPPGGSHCGYHRNSPFSADACGDTVFGTGLYSFDYRDYDTHTWSNCGNWNGSGGGNDWRRDGDYLVSKDGTKFQNSFIFHYRYHFKNGNEHRVYLLTDDNSDGSNIESNYKGYKVFVNYTGSGGLFGNYKIEVYKRTATGGGWSDVSSGGFDWYPYNNSIQDFDYKVTSSKIQIYINGRLIGEINRSDAFSGGYAGMYNSDNSGGECDSYSTKKVSPLWIIDDYTGSEPMVAFLGNTDLEIKRSKPTVDAAYTGADIVENNPRLQILDDFVDGNTLEQYIYSNYPLASLENQVFEYKLKITNKGASAETFNISLTANDLTSWYIAYQYDASGLLFTLPTNGVCTANLTTGCVDLNGGANKEITIFVMPSARVLFESGSGKLTLDFSVNAVSDMSFDNVSLISNIRGKLGCYWKWSLPITISYDDTNGTNDLINYQVLVNLSSVAEINSDALSNGEDIIFTDSSGSKIPFWQKSFNKAGGNASYWVNVPRIEAGTSPAGSTTINMWWGNPDYTVSLSNKKGTFDMWEDWENRNVNDIVGCPDGTSDCSGEADDPDWWQNNPDPQDNKNWWSIVNNQLGSNSVRASTSGSNDYGPILSGGDERWENYEAIYKHRKTGYGTNAYYNPVLYSDSGNMWGVEYYSNKFIFRPSTYGTDWAWVYQTTATSPLPDSSFPVSDGTYTSKIRVFKVPGGDAHLEIWTSEANNTPSDIDIDTGFYKIADFNPDPALSLDSGSIGFSGWSGGFSFDDIRVRQYTEPEPTVSVAASPLSVNYSPISSLSTPYLSPPLINGRTLLTNALLIPFRWEGNLTAIYADCYIGGDCETGEVQDKPGTISLWGKIDDDTPMGFGDRLKDASAGDNNRISIDATPGDRYIFTVRENGVDTAILGNCLDTASGDCLAFEFDNASVLLTLLGASSQTEAENLIRFSRGNDIASYTRSTLRDKTPFDGTKQWKLGDIVNSSPLLIGIPNMAYADTYYNTFKNNNSTRNLVAYFLSNEGMLHAVRLATFNSGLDPARYVGDSTAKELWAFVPSAVLSRIKETTDVDHEYTADGLLRAIDIKSGSSYKTILVGGLRTGGAALFAMDVTTPSSPKLLWEINDATHPTEFLNIGETLSSPALGKLCETETTSVCSGGRWVAVIGSGFATNDIMNLSKEAYVSIIDLTDGSIIKQIKVSTKVGNVTTDMAVYRDHKGFIKKVVFGDHYGALWRLNLTAASEVAAILDASKTTLGDAEMLFKPADYATSDILITGSGPQNSISAIPKLASGSSSGQLWIFVGTGVFNLYDSNYPYQNFYGFKDRDGSNGPYEMADLVDMTNTVTASNASKLSWYIQLGVTDAGDKQFSGTATEVESSSKDRNERVVNEAEVFGGFTFFTTFTSKDVPCGGGTTRFYVVGFETGAFVSDLMVFSNDTSGMAGTRSVAFEQTGGISSSPMIFSGKSGSGQVVGAGLVNSSTSGLSKVDLNAAMFTNAPSILFWREIR